MVNYSSFTLDNGLRVTVHEDNSTPLVAMNILYDVGSRDEDPSMTGMAHLFEHLMFSGTTRIPDFDTPLQLAGGENNAFTNNDITNYYITVPANNIETAFWLESDRMMELDFSQKNLETQKKVVIEEFRQRYLNQPYGDAILKLRPLAYKTHPYRWPAIGIDTSHVEKADATEIKNFFYSHYAPNNAILTISGNIKTAEARSLADKWFGPIGKRALKTRKIEQEPLQSEHRILDISGNVPSDAIYKVWHTSDRLSNDFFTLDLITDLLAGGESGRLYVKLVREKKLFSEINAYITSDIDPGLMIVSGKLMKGVKPEDAENEIDAVISSLADIHQFEHEMQKVKNKFEASTVFQNTSILNKAMNLAYYELLGDPGKINRESELYMKVSPDDVAGCLDRYLHNKNSSTLYYRSENRKTDEHI